MVSEKTKAMTFRELRSELAKLNNHQLDEPARFWGDDIGGTISKLMVLDEEFICIDGGVGMSPRSTYLDGDFTEDEIEARLPAGTPILSAEEA